MVALLFQNNTIDSLVNSPSSLSPLPTVLRKGLTAVCILGFISLLTSSCLLFHLTYRLLTCKPRANQFALLIFNLILADIQQSIAFLLNVSWVRGDAILVDSNICWSQGWFVSTGDLASGIFTFAIAMHSFADIVFDFRLSSSRFIIGLIALWTFVYTCAIIGLAIHPEDLYVRAGAWCWINARYLQERLWLHYIWVIMAECGTFIIYALTIFTLRRRIHSTNSARAARAIIAYPVVYVVCTLPLVIARLKAMANIHVSFLEFCIAGAMITSNGWLDVLLYSITRRRLLFGPDLGDESVRALDTFGDDEGSNWRADHTMGNTTTIQSLNRRPRLHQRLSSRTMERLHHLQRVGSEDEICSGGRGHMRGQSIVKTETVVEVTRSEVELSTIGEMERVRRMSDGNLKGRISFDITEASLDEKGEED